MADSLMIRQVVRSYVVASCVYIYIYMCVQGILTPEPSSAELQFEKEQEDKCGIMAVFISSTFVHLLEFTSKFYASICHCSNSLQSYELRFYE